MRVKAETCLRVDMERGLQWPLGDLNTLDPETLLQVWPYSGMAYF
jgi:hypothetical protein